MNYTRLLIVQYVLIFIVLVCLQSCTKDGVVPAYIYVPVITVKADPATEGTSSSKITHVSVYVNDNLQGTYELPAQFPIRLSGINNIKFTADIKVNGISATVAAYPFYRDTILALNLVPTKIDTVQPVVTYFKSAIFQLKEDFETGNTFGTKVDIVSNDPVNVFEGNNSAKMHVSSSDYYDTVVSSVITGFNPKTSSMFLELNYKNDYPFVSGLLLYKNGESAFVDKVAVNPQAAWNKIYINFTPEISQNQPDSLKVFFRMSRTDLATPANIYFDNVKLVNFP